MACTAIGPHPAIAVLDDEIKATKNPGHILLAPTTGTNTSDSENKLNKAVPAAAYSRYGDSLILASGLDGPLKTLKMPPHLASLLTLNWQVAFYHWLKDGTNEAAAAADAAEDDQATGDDGKDKYPAADKETDDKTKGTKDKGTKDKGTKDATAETTITRPKSEMEIEVPEVGKIPKNDASLKALSKLLKKKQSTYAKITKSIASGQIDDLADAVATNQKPLESSETLLQHLAQRLQANYILVSHLEGADPAAFAKNHPVTLHAALINLKTGKFRYYARTIGHKGDAPATMENLVVIMAQNMFKDLAKVDRVD